MKRKADKENDPGKGGFKQRSIASFFAPKPKATPGEQPAAAAGAEPAPAAAAAAEATCPRPSSEPKGEQLAAGSGVPLQRAPGPHPPPPSFQQFALRRPAPPAEAAPSRDGTPAVGPAAAAAEAGAASPAVSGQEPASSREQPGQRPQLPAAGADCDMEPAGQPAALSPAPLPGAQAAAVCEAAAGLASSGGGNSIKAPAAVAADAIGATGRGSRAAGEVEDEPGSAMGGMADVEMADAKEDPGSGQQQTQKGPSSGQQQAQQQQAQQAQPPQQQQPLEEEEEAGGEGEEEGEGEESPGERETEYERARAERIRRNMEVMRSMGLGGPGVSPKRAQQQKKKPPARRRASAPAPPLAERKYPLRSRRGSAAGVAAEGGEAEGGEAAGTRAPAPDEAPLSFDDSSVLRYVCEVAAPGAAAGAAGHGSGGSGEGAGRSGSGREAPEGAQVTGFAQLAGTLVDPALARAYSVDWRPGLVVAGGKDGQVSIFGSREVEASGLLPADADVPPLLSARLHRGWISDVQFVQGVQQPAGIEGSGSGGGPREGALGSSLLLLTAGNDGTVCLWDAARSAAQGRGVQPQQLAKCEDLHAGGIFSMHEAGGSVLTASKDCTVVVSTLGEGGSGTIRVVRRYEELHEGVVKCARWRDVAAFASCGNDRSICIVDTREGSSAAAVTLPDAHGTAVNCLRWHPSCDHLLLTASHDPHILLHDLRQPAQPLFTFTGHSLQGRISSIYQPAFVWGGAGVATGGEKSGCLSLYCTATGSTLSRGEVDFTIGATFCGTGRTDPLVCTAARTVHLLAPTWRPAGA